MTDRHERNLALGIDIGGTKIAIIVMTADGNVLQRRRRPTSKEGGVHGIVDDVVNCVQEEFADYLPSVHSAGIGVAGIVGRQGGTLFSAPNLDLFDVPLGSRISERLNRPAQLLNDVDAATYGEWMFGAASDVNTTIGVFLGTGVGGSIITDGRILEGTDCSAGEIGHMPIVAGGRTCSCGNTGCMEAYAGGWAIAERARERAEAEPERGELMIELAGSREEITARTVSTALSRGDELARELMSETEDLLGSWASGLVNVFNPDRMVLGGSVGEGFPQFGNAIEQYVNAHSFDVYTDHFDVRTAELGDGAVAVGAAARTLKQTVEPE